MTCVVDDYHAVIDIAQHRQHGDVGIGQAVLQAVPLHGVLENCFLAIDAEPESYIDIYNTSGDIKVVG